MKRSPFLVGSSGNGIPSSGTFLKYLGLRREGKRRERRGVAPNRPEQGQTDTTALRGQLSAALRGGGENGFLQTVLPGKPSTEHLLGGSQESSVRCGEEGRPGMRVAVLGGIPLRQVLSPEKDLKGTIQNVRNLGDGGNRDCPALGASDLYHGSMQIRKGHSRAGCGGSCL